MVGCLLRELYEAAGTRGDLADVLARGQGEDPDSRCMGQGANLWLRRHRACRLRSNADTFTRCMGVRASVCALTASSWLSEFGAPVWLPLYALFKSTHAALATTKARHAALYIATPHSVMPFEVPDWASNPSTSVTFKVRHRLRSRSVCANRNKVFTTDRP